MVRLMRKAGYAFILTVNGAGDGTWDVFKIQRAFLTIFIIAQIQVLVKSVRQIDAIQSAAKIPDVARCHDR